MSGVHLRLREIVGDAAQTQSGGKGEFRFQNLPPGIYSVEATAPGFARTTAEAIRVASRAEANVKIVMKIAPLFSCDPGPKTRFDPIQSTSSEIVGVVEGSPAGVKGPGWNHAENALITVTGPMLLTDTGPKSGNLVASTLTDKEGHFKLSIQEPGRYTVTAHQDGHADFVVEDIEARKGQRTTIQWALPLSLCPAADRCEPVREFPPLICM